MEWQIVLAFLIPIGLLLFTFWVGGKIAAYCDSHFCGGILRPFRRHFYRNVMENGLPALTWERRFLQECECGKRRAVGLSSRHGGW